MQKLDNIGIFRILTASAIYSGRQAQVDIPNGPSAGRLWRVVFAQFTEVDTGQNEPSQSDLPSIGIINVGQQLVTDQAAGVFTDVPNRGLILTDVAFLNTSTNGVNAINAMSFNPGSPIVIYPNQTLRAVTFVGGGFSPNVGSTLAFNIMVQELPIAC